MEVDMPQVDGHYSPPTSWDDIDSEYIENGDCADWIYAIRSAIEERANVLVGVRNGSRITSLIPPLYNGFHGAVQLYSFAKAVEVFLDKVLTIEDEWGTVYNTDNPEGQDGYFVNPSPSKFMRQVTYSDTIDGEIRTTVIPNYLSIYDVISQEGMNYKAALADVRKGDLCVKYVPFFNAVKNVLNYLTCVKVNVWAIRMTAAAVGWLNETMGGLEQDFTEEYNDEIPGPEYAMMDEHGTVFLTNYCYIENQSYGDPPTGRFYGGFGWNNLWVQGMSNKLPVINSNLYMGYFGYKGNDHGADNYEYGWNGNEYDYQFQNLGKCTGIEHSLEGGLSTKFPSGGLLFPTAMSRGVRNIIGYNMTINFFSDFGISGGFRFRNTGG